MGEHERSQGKEEGSKLEKYKYNTMWNCQKTKNNKI